MKTGGKKRSTSTSRREDKPDTFLAITSDAVISDKT